MMKVAKREEGQTVPEGCSVTITASNELYVKYQKTLENGDVVRLWLRIPKMTARDPNTWNWSDALVTKADQEANRQFQEGGGYRPKHVPENPAPPIGAGSCAVKPEQVHRESSGQLVTRPDPVPTPEPTR